MNKLCLVARSNPVVKRHFLSPVANVQIKSYCKSSKSDDNDNESTKKDEKMSSSEAANKLNDLLLRIVKDDNVTSQSKKLNLAQPRKREKNTNTQKKVESVEKQMVNAAKEVAKSIGGNVQQTESDLLLKLLNPEQNENSQQIYNLNDIIKGMKIDRETKPVEQKSRAEQVRQILNRASSSHSIKTEHNRTRHQRQSVEKRGPELVKEKIDVYGGKPLGIFTQSVDQWNEGCKNKTWNALYERDLKLAITHPPANYYQQMILWTEQGKLWKFPIDNEQGLEKEKNVCFTEHVFLDKHLEPWCPQKGPLRHFMELVCVGLSKNPYLTVEAKKEHIDWYKNYFEDKKKILQDTGAFPVDNKTEQRKLE